MDHRNVARLTEQQRACLRFVYARTTSKEIAPRMGIEPGSVDQHIKAAMRVLGVSDRRTAARLLAEDDARSGFQPLVYQPPDIAMPLDSSTFGPPIESGRQQHYRASGEALRE